ncbi:hypothetical protein K1T71_013850 [Dendrolimus kikuchii]|uniref:Uncharacterized protein n=1 Tax=Dendrolimus kikuchii TaxID=765133 RepID=A0ACC1CFZ3_9NEOP|nr:hypothetical protein K1T71_013850 [Dendrolimus kikuchii]
MSLNPLNELKRRLKDTGILLPKRLCLAKNVIQSHNFPSAPKERVIADWLQELNENKILKGEELKNILDWLNICDDLSSELKIKLVQIVSQYIQTNPIQDSDIQKTLVSFIENDKIKLQLNSLIDDYLTIIITLLQNMKNNVEHTLTERIFNNIMKYYRESKKKLEFIIKLLNGENIETIFSYLNTEYRNTVINVCQNILFPLNKRTYFISFLQTLIRKDNLDELIAEKGDNIQSVLKIMDALFAFPKGRTDMSVDFIKHFIDVFVSCFHTESQIVFAFYIMVANFLDLQQNYITPAMNLPTVQLVIEKADKCQRLLFLNMLEILLANEVDISIRLTDTFGEKIPKVEIKKTFILFLQAVMMNQLKLENKPDKITIEIVKTALKLDPTLIEQKMIQIVPPLMISKKNNTKILESYTDMLTCLLGTLFKLSRGILFINQILPNVKLSLESCNTEQFELKQTLLEDESNEKIRNKIITGNDIFPRECVEVYGKLTSELMFRQNKELLVSLQKDLEVYCLTMLEEGFISSSIITLTEVLSAILSSFLCNSKMADHTVPLPIAEDFWNAFKTFEDQCIRKFGECILKLPYNPQLVTSFLKLCLSVAQMKLLNIKYSNVKIDMTVIGTEIYDLSSILPCLTSEEWMGLASNIKQDEAVMLMDNLILVKRSITELLALKNIDTMSNLDFTTTNTYFITRIATTPEILDNTLISRTLFSNIDGKQCKELVKTLIKVYMSNPEQNIFKSDVLKNNRLLQNCLTIEVTRNISKCFDNCDLLSKKLSKIDFIITEFAKENDMKQLFINLKIKPEIQDETIKNYINILTELQIPYLDKNYQLVVIFLTLAIKKCCLSKKIKRNINKILQSIYELSLLPPSLYQIFPTDYIFDFENMTILNLVTLKKTSYDLLIVKILLEIAVKRVKIESELVTSVVELLLQKKVKNSNTMDVFNDPVFQISCTILPLLVKQKQLITASVHRSILADLQDKLQKELLESFKNIDFTQISGFKDDTGNIDESLVDSDNIAILNAMAAYALTLSRYCETTDVEEIKNLDYLWSGLEFFVYNAINSLSNPSSKQQYIESSVQLLSTILRYIKKLETHEIFKQKDEIFNKIWECLKIRLMLINEASGRFWNKVLDDTTVALKFLFELSSVECFCSRFVGDIGVLSVLKKPNEILKDGKKTDEIKHKVAKFLIIQCLKANIIGPKCVAMSKLTYKNCRNLNFWIRQHYDEDSVANKRKRKFNIYAEDGSDEKKIIKIDDSICDLIRTDLETLSEVILAAKKITLDYKYLDSIFELQHMINHIMGLSNARLKCEISSNSYFLLYEGCILILNSLIVSREEMLEDRWPCFMQCYRALVTSLCERSSSQIEIERSTEEKLAVTAHSIEKRSQSLIYFTYKNYHKYTGNP